MNGRSARIAERPLITDNDIVGDCAVIILKILGYVLLVLLTSAFAAFTIGFVIGIIQSVRKEFRGQKREPAKREPKKRCKAKVCPALRVVWPD